MRLVLVRLFDNGYQTLGRLYLFDAEAEVLSCATLEPAWQDNKKQISCIPWGRYTAQQRTSNRFGEHLIVEDIQGREYILIHAGNFRRDTSGCILVGSSFRDIDRDGQLDVVDSRRALRTILNYINGAEAVTLDVVGVVAP